MDSYQEFLQTKTQQGCDHGFEPLYMNDKLFDFQKDLVEWSLRKGRGAIFADCGLGKGQPYGSQILTPVGWKNIEELSIGDSVIDSSGNPSLVTGVYPKRPQNTYRIHFSDRSSFVVDEDHLHICRTNNDRQRDKPWRVMSTSDLLSCGNLRYGKSGRSRNYDIPIVKDVKFESTTLPIDPYVMGVLLGDGHFKGNISISSADMFVIKEVIKRLPEGVTLEQISKYDWRIITGSTGCRRHSFRQTICDMGLYNHLSYSKFIPDEYLYSSPHQRLMLLRGLMDTDGYIDKGGTCQFYSVSKSLASGVKHLIGSLGGIPTETVKQTSCDGKPGRPCSVITFSLATHNPFFLKRKAKRWNPCPRGNGRWIDSIEFEKVQPTVCISVDSKDNSYVTENFIVTHNTVQQLTWAENVVRKTNGRVLVLTPLAVSFQTAREATKFGIEAKVCRDGKIGGPGIYITNYERLHYFKTEDFEAVVADESGILKNFDGKTKADVTDFMRKKPYRLLCTATPSPNDYIELGTSSEALGELGFMDMVGRFFKKSEKTTSRSDELRSGIYRFRGHAEKDFWRWVCSWARAIRKPSDLGYSDEGFILPELKTVEHVVKSRRLRDGWLFDVPAVGLQEQREERRRTIDERCEKAASLVSDTNESSVCWCHLNDEGDLLTKMIPGAVQIAGKDSDERKEEVFEAFQNGEIKKLVTKPQIAGFGVNWQHCSHQTFFPSHSFEQWYQAIRRSWRFGQEKPVTIDVVTTEGGKDILSNMKRKHDAAEKMMDNLVSMMNEELKIVIPEYGKEREEIPAWL